MTENARRRAEKEVRYRAACRKAGGSSHLHPVFPDPVVLMFHVAPSTVEDALPPHLARAFATAFRVQVEAGVSS